MSSALDIVFGKITKPEKGTVIVLTSQGPEYSDMATILDEESGGAIIRAAEFSEFKGKNSSAVDLIAPANLKASRILVIGIGDISSDDEPYDWSALGGRIYAKLSGRDKPVTIVADLGEDNDKISTENAAEIGFGMALRSYSFDKYKSASAKKGKGSSKSGPEKVTIQCAEPAKTRKAFANLKAIYEGMFVARDLVNEPSNILGPGEFASRIKELEELGIEVEILNEAALKKKKMNAILCVGQGSTKPTCLAIMKWNGAKNKSEAPVGFVGKGVTFDTGGISIKPAFGMEDMKGDMAGAACVTGLMHTLASRKAKVNAVGVVGLVENMPGPDAQKPGDVVTAMSGKTIEIINTDAEGRLVLADAIWYCQETFKPKFVINLATLTGAILVALGSEYAGVFSNNDELAEQLADASQKTGEKVWRLPLNKNFDKMVDSKIADMKNSAGRFAGSITAAQFLQRFVKPETPWIHLDIAGTGMGSPKTDVNTSWGAGFGVHLLNQLVTDNYED